MRSLEEHVTQYAAYHRDRRNIMTHFVGVPMIVFSVVLALAQVHLGNVHAGWIGVLLAGAYYTYLDRPLGLALFGFLVVCGAVASLLTMKVGSGAALAAAVFVFVVGWIIQFVGHRYEGVKPAFMDDLMGLAIGPLFVTTEAFFLLGLRPELQAYVEARVGPTLAARNGALLQPRGLTDAANSNFSTDA